MTNENSAKIQTWFAIVLTLATAIAIVWCSGEYFSLRNELFEIKSTYVRKDVIGPQLDRIQLDLAEIKADVKAHIKATSPQ